MAEKRWYPKLKFSDGYRYLRPFVLQDEIPKEDPMKKEPRVVEPFQSWLELKIALDSSGER